MTQFFISYSRDCDFWDDEGGARHPSREFWNWAEVMLGDYVGVSTVPTPEAPWAITPHTAQIKDANSEQGWRYENGRLLTFLNPELAMMFKLRWI